MNWKRVEEIFSRALEYEGDERALSIREACGGDSELLCQVSSLLETHEVLEAADREGSPSRLSLDPGRAALLLDSDLTELTEGTQIGRYQVIRKVAQGGTGVVYLAFDPRLDRRVALKLLRWRTTDPSADRRLEEEARATSAPDHPHIATIYEIGESEGGHRFIAMAWYEGGTLRDRLNGMPLPPAEAVEIARQIAEGLAAAHARGISHRDIKPENIAFGAHGRATILDFGIASAVSGSGGSEFTPGTLAYMSPEQARGEDHGPQGDIWALGVVLYEMLAGVRPFHGTPPEVLRRVREGVLAPLCDHCPDVPPSIAAVVHRCLDRDPDQRFPSADALLHALRSASLHAQPARAHPVPGVVTGILLYAGFSLPVFFAADLLAGRFFLPEWLVPTVLGLLLAGLPLIAATSLVAESPFRRGPGEDPRSLPLLTWPRTAAGGLISFLCLALIVSVVVAVGIPRITEARGVAPGFAAQPQLVISEFEASEGMESIAIAVREALAVDIGQSNFISVVSPGRIQAIMARMGIEPPARLDLATALEVAERGGAGAVLTGSVARVGNQYVLTGRAVDPLTREELFAVRTAAGERRLLGAVEKLSREVRGRLGERRDLILLSRPLPEVSTRSIEALRLYALSEDRHLQLDYRSAETLANEALEIDPGFAMAHRLAGAAALSQLSYGRARLHMTRAFELRERLTERERRHVEAAYHLNVTFQPRSALWAYDVLLRRHPDDVRAWTNMAATLHSWMDDSERSLAAYRRALELDGASGFALGHGAFMAMATGRGSLADSLASRVSSEAGSTTFGPRWRLSRAFAAGDARMVGVICDSLLARPAATGGPAEDAELCGSMDIASGRIAQGISRLESVQTQYSETGRHRSIGQAAQSMAVGHSLRGENDQAADRLAAALELVPSAGLGEPDRFIFRTNLRIHAAWLGESALERRVAATYPPYHDPSHWFGHFAESLVVAAGHVSAGDGEAALLALEEGRAEGLMPIGWRIWDAILRGLAHELAGRPALAASHLHRAAEPGYLFIPYLTKDRILLPIALAGLARTEEASGNHAASADARRLLQNLWAERDEDARLPLHR
jgi:tetratricopeptide (TPR) repeat protein